VVALAVVMGAQVPEPGKSLDDEEAFAAGRADGNARLGNLDQARAAAERAPKGGGGQVRALITLASAAAATNQKDVDNLVTDAVEAVKTARNRPDLDWPQLFLIEEGLRAGVPTEKLEPVIASIVDRELAAWGRLLLLRDRLKKSDSVVPVDSVEAIPARSLAGMVARLEVARHNTYQDRGWANTIKDWDEGPQALASLGVALGMQGEK
jgi:hypothetical protein